MLGRRYFVASARNSSTNSNARIAIDVISAPAINAPELFEM